MRSIQWDSDMTQLTISNCNGLSMIMGIGTRGEREAVPP